MRQMLMPLRLIALPGLTTKNVLCFKALLNFCYSFGALLGFDGWTTALRAFDSLERVLQKTPGTQCHEHHTMLRQALDSVFETTALLPENTLNDVIDAIGQHLWSLSDHEDAAASLNWLVELCTYNLVRLLTIWVRIINTVHHVCSSNSRGDNRGAAAVALCRILARAFRKEALCLHSCPDVAQEEFLKPLEPLLRVPREEARAKVCEGLLAILQASGQELEPRGWCTMIHLIATAAQVELGRAGLQFSLTANESCDNLQPQEMTHSAPPTITTKHSASQRPCLPMPCHHRKGVLGLHVNWQGQVAALWQFYLS